MNMNREFPGSANLAVLLKWYGWALYDITTSLTNPYSPSWDELVFNEATRYESSHRYLLLPIPEKGKTLQKTYASLRDEQIHPILRIPRMPSKEEKNFNIKAENGFADHNFDGYYLNEFYFQKDALYTSSSILFSYTFSLTSRVTIPTPHVLSAFSNYFCLIQFTKQGTVIKRPAQNYATIN